MSEMTANSSVPVVGIVGNDVPRQLVLAANALPHRVTGSWTGRIDQEASELLGAADAVTARILTGLLAGTDDLDALVICNDSQAHLRLYYALRAVGTELPLLLLDVPGSRRAPAQRFAERQFLALVEFCANLSGHRPDARSLRRAADEERALGDALARLGEARRGELPRCSGTRALELHLLASRSHPADAVPLVEAGCTAETVAGVRVHLTGSAHPDPTVYRALEERGCLIVGEDHDTGERTWLGEAVPGDGIDEVVAGLVRAHFARVPASTTASGSERAEFTAAMASAGRAELVAAIVRDLDEAPLWDLPDQAAALNAQGRELRTRTHVGADDAIAVARELAQELVGRAAS